eukprot:CAMPEP_0172174904 /NCGR_PEP_ID=MMETSP1050-20130122/13925_1 /TAXON_ID=233186 /ORGANISM="Cryptomonas curvata, Strain CCAP979/52" /LENGTH=132 /DNA_ID=CAMNT_0012846935 /DNA_START=344 /DNA_END=739 /DNA_ORIENTATION=+
MLSHPTARVAGRHRGRTGARPLRLHICRRSILTARARTDSDTPANLKQRARPAVTVGSRPGLAESPCTTSSEPGRAGPGGLLRCDSRAAPMHCPRPDPGQGGRPLLSECPRTTYARNRARSSESPVRDPLPP